MDGTRKERKKGIVRLGEATSTSESVLAMLRESSPGGLIEKRKEESLGEGGS